jgi:hypothetical protein
MADIRYRPATPEDWGAIAQHFYDLWRDNGVPATGIRPDWQTITLAWIIHERYKGDRKKSPNRFRLKLLNKISACILP